MASFLPDTTVLFLAIALSTLRFENQRWVRARMGGLRGSSEWVGFLVDLTGWLSLVFSVLFLIAYGYDAGWRPAVGLAVATIAASTLLSILIAAVARGDNVFVWVFSTVALWPVAMIMTALVTWFGLRG